MVALIIYVPAPWDCVNALDFVSTAVSDYLPTTVVVTFASGVTTASVSVPIVDDSNIESTEMFTATLTTTESNVMIGEGTTTVTILDDDGESLCMMQSQWGFMLVY